MCHPSIHGQKKTLNEKLKKRVQFLLTKFKVDHMIDGKSSEVGDMIKPAKKNHLQNFLLNRPQLLEMTLYPYLLNWYDRKYILMI